MGEIFCCRRQRSYTGLETDHKHGTTSNGHNIVDNKTCNDDTEVELHVRTLVSKEVFFHTPPILKGSDELSTISSLIQESEGIPIDQQCLILPGGVDFDLFNKSPSRKEIEIGKELAYHPKKFPLPLCEIMAGYAKQNQVRDFATRARDGSWDLYVTMILRLKSQS